MGGPAMIGIPARNIDDALDRVGRTRERLLADRAVAGRAERLAMSFESEARAWSQLYELAEERIVWRAALAAELAARRQAVLWWRLAVEEAAPAVIATSHTAAARISRIPEGV
jgi:hypothetical protein